MVTKKEGHKILQIIGVVILLVGVVGWCDGAG